MMENKIDFVVLWVDGNDKKWQQEKEKYSPKKISNGSNGNVRYRDWDNLKYWFRGVEKFASWVNNVYFITWGHLPSWLNIKNPKLKIIKHEDYIPEKYLPTFSSNPIELNVNKIKNLSENFVLFNDDTFLINEVSKEDFFKNGLPCDNYNEVNLDLSAEDDTFASTITNNYKILNKYYDKRKVIMKNIGKYINVKYGLKRNLQTIKTTLTRKDFIGINNNHIAQAFLKSYFDKLWELEYDTLDETSIHKFRNKNDVTQWLVRYFQLMDGKFVPRDYKLGKFYVVGNDNDKIIKDIREQRYKIICINDSDKNIDFEKCKKEINDSLNYILGEKSSFEK